MTEPKPPEFEPITAWHPMLVALLERYLPAGWQLLAEFLLGRLPQRVDIVVLRRLNEIVGAPRKLHSILDHLRPHTLIEHKGPTDDLDPGDATTLIGYAAQYMRLCDVRDPGELCLMVVADRIPKGFAEQIERHGGAFTRQGGGLWTGHVAGWLLHGVETREACREGTTERLLYAFSRAYLTAPGGILPLDEDETQVYTALYEQVEQFRKRRGDMALKDMDAASKSYDEVIAEIIAKMPPEKVLRHFTPEQILSALTPEMLSALTPEALQQLQKKMPH